MENEEKALWADEKILYRFCEPAADIFPRPALHSKPLARLETGDVVQLVHVQVLDKKCWYSIQTKDGRSGCIMGSGSAWSLFDQGKGAFEPLLPRKRLMSNEDLRERPSTSSTVLGQIRKDTFLYGGNQVTGEDSQSWSEVATLDERRGYMRTSQLSEAPWNLRERYTGCIDYSPNLSGVPSLEALKAVALHAATKSAARTSIVWGLINLGLWYGSTDNLPKGIPPMDTGLQLLRFSWLALGLATLACGLLSLFWRRTTMLLIDAAILGALGIYNIVSLFVVIEIYASHGQSVSMPPGSTIIICLGIGQVVQSIRQVLRFDSLSQPSQTAELVLTAAEVEVTQHSLKKAGRNPETGMLCSSRKTTQLFPIYRELTETVLIFLLPDKAVCVYSGFSDAFAFTRQSLAEKTHSTSEFDVVDTKGQSRTLCLPLPYLETLNGWAKGQLIELV